MPVKFAFILNYSLLWALFNKMYNRLLFELTAAKNNITCMLLDSKNISKLGYLIFMLAFSVAQFGGGERGIHKERHTNILLVWSPLLSLCHSNNPLQVFETCTKNCLNHPKVKVRDVIFECPLCKQELWKRLFLWS